MGTVDAVWRVEVRRNARTYLGIVALLAVGVGLCLMCIAGARRTQSAYPRFLRAADASTMVVASKNAYDPDLNARVAALPQVVQSRTYVSFQVFALTDGRPDPTRQFEAAGTFDGEYFDQDRFTPTSGRRPARDRADEVAFDELAAQRYGYHVGQRLELGTYSFTTQLGDFFSNPRPPDVTTEATIVGIGLFPDEVVQDEGDRTPRLLVTPAFTTASAADITYALQGLVLRHGASDVAAVQEAIAAMGQGGGLEYQVIGDELRHAEQAVRPVSIALASFGTVVGLAVLVLAAQAINRALRSQQPLRNVLRALGAPPRTIIGAAMVCPAIAIVVGTALATLVAIGTSPLMPTGPVAKVEPQPGVSIDLIVLGVGALLVIVVLGAATALTAAAAAPERVLRRDSRTQRPSRLSEAAAQAGAGPALLSGIRFAFERTRAAGSAARSVMIGACVAVVALTASITFGASFTNVVRHPALYGWSGDAVISAANGYGNIPLDDADRILAADADVASWSGVYFGIGALDGVGTPLLGMDPGEALLPPVLSGRMIGNPDEVVLGRATADALHKSIGDSLSVAEPSGPKRLAIVGIATFPAIGAVHLAHAALGTGAIVAHELVPGWDADLTGTKHGDFGPRGIFVRFVAGVDHRRAIAKLQAITAPLAGFAGLDVLPVQRPAEITVASSAAGLPIILASLLGVAVAISLGLALSGAARHRAHELAILRTIGFTRRQLAGSIKAMASVTVIVGLLCGIPLGAALGRSTWSVFARQLDVVDTPVIPTAVVALLLVTALGVANVVAAGPARRASRISTATELNPH